jgi:hypothetical protein
MQMLITSLKLPERPLFSVGFQHASERQSCRLITRFGHACQSTGLFAALPVGFDTLISAFLHFFSEFIESEIGQLFRCTLLNPCSQACQHLLLICFKKNAISTYFDLYFESLKAAESVNIPT